MDITNDINDETQLAKPTTVVDLRSSAVLVYIKSRVWGGTMQDNEISNEVIADKNATSGTAKVTKMLLAGDERHRAVSNHRQRMSAWATRMTFPFAANLDLLPAARYPAFRAEFDVLKAEFDRLVEEFIAGFDESLSNAAFRLNGMFDRSDYPSQSELRHMFRMELVVTDVPAGDFRNVMIQSIADDLHVHYQRQHEEIVNNITKQQKGEMLRLAKSVAHGCGTTDKVREDGTTKVVQNRLHETTVERLIEQAAAAKQFNPTHDEEVETIADRVIEVMDGVNVEKLRTDAATRSVVQAEMEDILSKFGF